MSNHNSHKCQFILKPLMFKYNLRLSFVGLQKYELSDSGKFFWGSQISHLAIALPYLTVPVFADVLSSVFLPSPQYLLACCGGSSPPPVFSSECFMPHQQCLSYSLSISSRVSHALHS